MSQERAGFARELETELASVASDKSDTKSDGHVVGALHRAWIDTKTALGAGDHEILAWLEQGEDYAKKKYEDALSKGLPAGVLAIVRRQAQSIRSVHDRVRSMRDEKAA
ncbi:MAG: PA2169 family four-helix-bundle protein [Terriglobales bacterium]